VPRNRLFLSCTPAISVSVALRALTLVTSRSRKWVRCNLEPNCSAPTLANEDENSPGYFCTTTRLLSSFSTAVIFTPTNVWPISNPAHAATVVKSTKLPPLKYERPFFHLIHSNLRRCLKGIIFHRFLSVRRRFWVIFCLIHVSVRNYHKSIVTLRIGLLSHLLWVAATTPLLYVRYIFIIFPEKKEDECIFIFHLEWKAKLTVVSWTLSSSVQLLQCERTFTHNTLARVVHGLGRPIGCVGLGRGSEIFFLNSNTQYMYMYITFVICIKLYVL